MYPLIHWAKEVDAMPDLTTYLWTNNGENMRKFLHHLGTKVDMKKKLFFNQFLEEIFFPKTPVEVQRHRNWRERWCSLS